MSTKRRRLTKIRENRWIFALSIVLILVALVVAWFRKPMPSPVGTWSFSQKRPDGTIRPLVPGESSEPVAMVLSADHKVEFGARQGTGVWQERSDYIEIDSDDYARFLAIIFPRSHEDHRRTFLIPSDDGFRWATHQTSPHHWKTVDLVRAP